MASSGEKSLAVGHIPGFQIDPNTGVLVIVVVNPFLSEQVKTHFVSIIFLAFIALVFLATFCA